MITFKNVTLFRQHQLLFENANFRIQRGWKVGIIGQNGAGKSSLFALLQNELCAEKGEVIVPISCTINTVQQEINTPDENALDFVLQGDAALFELLKREKTLHNAEDIAHFHESLEHFNAYSARARALQILSGLGFSQEVAQKKLSEFSGGWQMRLNLARTLFAPADLLLLDEPTNHLDFNAILWLENWLAKTPATVLLIAHDKHFLNASANHILSFENKHLYLQKGNYATYEKNLAERLATQQASAKKINQKRAHLEDFIRRFRAKATKAKQAQSRLKMLEKLKVVDSIHAQMPFSFQFETDSLPAHTLIKMENVHFAYAQSCIFENLQLVIDSNSRIGLLGKNGTGKSTLMKLCAGVLLPQKGTILRAKNLKIGYFAQQSIENLNAQQSALEHLTNLAPEKTAQELRSFLGRFAFSDDLALLPVASLSGGEKARLTLALIAFQQPHVLLLDEPTNHLDIIMREALVLALQNFEGALLLVSHDRYLLENVCNELWLIDNSITEFNGDLDDYARLLSEKPSSEKKAPKPNKQKREEEKKAREALLNQKRTLKKEFMHIDALLSQKQSQLENWNAQFLLPDFYQRPDAHHLQKEAKILKNEIEHLENTWLNLSTQLDELENQEKSTVN